MLIDWFTVGAQALNFLVLIWLLKHFLYKPILDAIGSRERHIAEELADAAAKQAQAQKERDDFQRKSANLDLQRDALLHQAKEAAGSEKERLLVDARQAAEVLRIKQQEAMRSEAHNLAESVRRRTQEEVFDIVRKTLADLAGASLEERVTETFTFRLRALDGAAKDEFAGALRASAGLAIVRSAFVLPQAQRAALQKAINELAAADVSVRFETAPELISGIELTAKGQKVAWSISDYLMALERGVSELLPVADKPHGAAAPKLPTASADAGRA